jgi:hypothetical protein
MRDIAEQLRAAILDIRRKPYPISDLIPLLSRAADEIDKLSYIDAQIEQEKIDKHCQQRLMSEGKPYPRTCAVCKLGPCKL